MTDYMVFAHQMFYPLGGLEDFQALRSTYDECLQIAEALKISDKDYHHIQIGHIDNRKMVVDLYLFRSYSEDWHVEMPSNYHDMLEAAYDQTDH